MGSVRGVDRRMALVGVAVLVALIFLAVTDAGSAPPGLTLASQVPTTIQPTSRPEPESSTTTADPAVAALSSAVAVVMDYWAALSSDGSNVAAYLDVSPEDLTREVGLAEYSAAYGGRYEAECSTGVVVGDEIVVDCTVEVLDEPMVAAFQIGASPTQFRVRDGLITSVGYLKPYSTVDLALSSLAMRTDPAGFAAACRDPEGAFQADAGVVYNRPCGEYMAGLVSSVVAEVRAAKACGDDCDAALLSAIRPSKD